MDHFRAVFIINGAEFIFQEAFKAFKAVGVAGVVLAVYEIINTI